jgi:hypothetical protein
MAVKDSFYFPDESIQENKAKEIESPQTSNGFYQNFMRLDLLTRTTEGTIYN